MLVSLVIASAANLDVEQGCPRPGRRASAFEHQQQQQHCGAADHLPPLRAVEKDAALLQRSKSMALKAMRKSLAGFEVTIVSYNLYWWNIQANNRWGALYDRITKQMPFDLIGFQECEDVARIIDKSGLEDFDFYQGPNKPKNNPAPIAWNEKLFTKLAGPSEKWVASDGYGGRYMVWVRLQHKASGVSVFFANTHGPLGNCGSTLGNNWVAGIRENKDANDVVFVTGDYNCWTGTSAMKLLKQELNDDGVNDVDAGIDQILTDFGLYQKESGGGKLEGWPSDHPLVKGTFGIGPTPPPTPQPTPAPTVALECAPFDQWPNVAGSVTCENCMALVRTSPYSGSCDNYCKSFNHVCVAAAEEVNNNCDIKYASSCDDEITGTSDMLCTCQGTPQPQPTPAPTVALDCVPFDQWPNVAGSVTCENCRALVRTSPYSGSCDDYCKSFNHVCVAAAEEVNNNCDIKYASSCDDKITGTSDMLCTCRSGGELLLMQE
jgi:hypothetical protein